MGGRCFGVMDDEETPRLIGQTAADCKWRLKSLTEEGFSGWVTDRWRPGCLVKPKPARVGAGYIPKGLAFRQKKDQPNWAGLEEAATYSPTEEPQYHRRE